MIIFRVYGKIYYDKLSKESTMDYRQYIAQKLNLDCVTAADIVLPPNSEMGDYALPCFKLAKVMRKSPAVIAEELKNSYTTDEVISGVSAVNGYLNFSVNKVVLANDVLKEVLSSGDKYGSSTQGK